MPATQCDTCRAPVDLTVFLGGDRYTCAGCVSANADREVRRLEQQALRAAERERERQRFLIRTPPAPTRTMAEWQQRFFERQAVRGAH
jgi:hypothetical protein